MDPEELRSACLGNNGVMSESAPTVKEAINAAAHVCDHGQDLILVTGSFYVVGEAKHLIESKLARR